MDSHKDKHVLDAVFVRIDNKLFYYEIVGEAALKEVFRTQKNKYTWFENERLLYSVPWYFGKQCVIREQHFSKKFYLDIGEYSRIASVTKQFGRNFWAELAKKYDDPNWLTRRD